ncbi:hypothetical protein S40293_03219 [Stachybotrys chartarum IBT 40293]|nr:hypothetical protein S40293_03219 [Stachybotrys chartarum IBT 40293]
MWTNAASSIFLIGHAVSRVTAACPPDLRGILLDEANEWSSGAVITFPEDGADFYNVTERWSPYEAPTFAAAISVATEEDVIQAVQLAREHQIAFLATGGRHSVVNTLESFQQGLAVDLSNLKSVQIDEAAMTLTVGGGIRTRDIYGPVSQAGFWMPVGSCSCPGLVGVTIGGGANVWSGTHGMISDLLLSVRMITAEGELVEVSQTQNPDLFWGLRGAGANFGIITSATYQLQRRPENNILVVDVLFPPQANISYYEAVAELSRHQPAELSASHTVTYNGTLGLPLIAGSFLYFGPREQGLDLLAPIFALNPIFRAINVVPWERLPATIQLGADAQICLPGSIHNTYGGYMRNLSVPYLIRTFTALSQFYAQYPSARRSVAVYRHRGRGGPADDIPDDATAYAWRNSNGGSTTANVDDREINLSWPAADTATEAAAVALGERVRSDFVATSGYDELAVHVNIARRTDTLEQVYGVDRLPRLAALKSIWDPNNVFGYHHPLPTSYP